MIRHDAHGYWLPRPDPGLEAILDRTLLRRRPWERRWVDRPKAPDGFAEDLAGSLPGTSALVLGKGPSLDAWLASPTTADVVVALNEVGLLVPSATFLVFFDRAVGLRLEGISEARWSPVTPPQVFGLPRFISGPRFTWDYGRGVFRPEWATAACAFRFVGLLGCDRVEAIGFDGRRGVDGYAKALVDLGVPARGLQGYDRHNGEIDEAIQASGLSVVFR